MELSDKALKLTPKRLEAMHTLGLFTSEQLIRYYPFRYELLASSSVQEWKEKDKVCFEATVLSKISSYRFGKGHCVSKFDVLYQQQVLKITVYNRPWLKSLPMDRPLTLLGIYDGKKGVTVTNYYLKPLAELPSITPVYATKGSIKQKTIRDTMRHVLDVEGETIVEDMPICFQRAYRLLDQRTALKYVHFPDNVDQVRQALRTLKYEEFLHYFVALELLKQENGMDMYRMPRIFDEEQLRRVIDTLPFSLTRDQLHSLQDILHDLTSNHAMYRLVQGDVGCGKTLVAALALYAVVLSGAQGALLAPTEILARQHLLSIRDLLAPFKVCVDVLYSGQKTAEKERILKDTENGKIQILIGTHSLLQEEVRFKNLGMVVADEQQRFGVGQRRMLKNKGEHVDFLLMSATPIPRTLASTLYGDMQISTIQTMPMGRKPVKTMLIRENSFRSVLSDVVGLLKEGRQLYVICAAVEENVEMNQRSVEKVAENLTRLFQDHYRVGSLHGRMSSLEKQEIMSRFDRGEFQVLVSTTVVEVGMNVVNATGMIIYDADRFGLSQLHQLRGRVQRGSGQGFCWLLTDSKDPHTLERLQVLERTTDGFVISEEDLRLRGPGDILGTRQSGVPDLVLGNLIEDTKIIHQARKDAKAVVMDPQNPDFVPILDAVRARNENNYGFAD